MRTRILLFLTLLTNAAVLGCNDLSELSRNHRVLAGQIQSDVDGILTASVDTASGSAVVGASGSSGISGASILFPSGSLAIPTDIIVEEGASIATAAFMSSVNESAAAGLTQASNAVSVSSSTAQDAISPFSISLPLSGLGLNLVEESGYIAVLFKIYKASEDKYYSGVIPTNQLSISSTAVQFTTANFGVFQAIYVNTAITERSEQIADTTILTKSQEEALATVSWQRPTYTYDDTQRILKASVVATNLQEPRDCVIILDSDKVQPWNYARRSLSNALTALEIPIDPSLRGSFYVAASCIDKYGRISKSLWSDTKVTIQISAVGETFAITQMIPAPNSTTSVLMPTIEVLFNNNIDSSSVVVTNISLKNSNTKREIPITALSVANNKLTFKPVEQLAINGRYSVELKPGIRDITGNSLITQTWMFQTNKIPTMTLVSPANIATSGATQTKVIDLGNGKLLQLFKDGDALKSSYFNGSSWSTGKVDATNYYTDGTLNYEAHLLPNNSVLLICACDEFNPSTFSPLRSYIGSLSGSTWVWGTASLLNSQISTVPSTRGNFKSITIPGVGAMVMYDANSSNYSMKMNLFMNGAWQSEYVIEGVSRSSSSELLSIDYFQGHLLMAWTYYDGSNTHIVTTKFQLDETLPATNISVTYGPFTASSMKAYIDPMLGQTIFIKGTSAAVQPFYKSSSATSFTAVSTLASYHEMPIIKKADGRLILVSSTNADSNITATVIKNGAVDSTHVLQNTVTGLSVQNIEVHQGINADWVAANVMSTVNTKSQVLLWKHQANAWSTSPFQAFSIGSISGILHTRLGHDEHDNLLVYSSHDSQTAWTRFYYNQLTGAGGIISPTVSIPYSVIDAPCSLFVRPTGESVMTCLDETGNLSGERRY